jgi:hypothetical protein
MAWVQSTFPKSTQTTQLTTQSVTFDGKVTAGNCLLVCVTYSTVPGATISSITDSHSNTWTQVELVTDTTATQATAVYSTFGCAGGATTITVHFSGSGATYIGVIAAEYTNASSVDVHNSNQAAPSVTTNGMTTGSVTTTAASETIVAFFVCDQTSDELTAGTSPNIFVRRESSMISGSTDLSSSNYPSMMLEDFAQTSAGAINPTGTIPATSGRRYSGIVIALKTGTTNTPAISGLAASYPGAYSTNTATKTLTVTTQPGDYLVVYGGGENSGMTLTTPTGNSVSFTLQKSVVVSTRATAYIWSGIDSTGGTNWTLTCTSPGGNKWGFSCLVFRGIAGIGASASSNAAASTGVYPQLSLNTTGNSSSLVVFVSDYNAIESNINGYIHHWQAINGTAPTTGNGREIDVAPSGIIPTSYSLNGAIYDNVGAYNASIIPKVYFPDSQQYSMVALEIYAPLVYAGFTWLKPYLGGTLEFSEDFENGTVGTSVTSLTNPTGFETPGTPGGTGTIDSSMYVYGSKSLRLNSDGTAGNFYYLEHHYSSSTNDAYIRFCLFLPSIPAANLLIVSAVTAGNAEATDIRINTDGTVSLRNNNVVVSGTGPTGGTSSASVPIGSWFTLEYNVSSTTGTQTLKIYKDVSSTLQETLAPASSYTQGTMTSFKIGIIATNSYSYWLDCIADSVTGWVGPA